MLTNPKFAAESLFKALNNSTAAVEETELQKSSEVFKKIQKTELYSKDLNEIKIGILTRFLNSLTVNNNNVQDNEKILKIKESIKAKFDQQQDKPGPFKRLGSAIKNRFYRNTKKNIDDNIGNSEFKDFVKQRFSNEKVLKQAKSLKDSFRFKSEKAEVSQCEAIITKLTSKVDDLKLEDLKSTKLLEKLESMINEAENDTRKFNKESNLVLELENHYGELPQSLIYELKIKFAEDVRFHEQGTINTEEQIKKILKNIKAKNSGIEKNEQNKEDQIDNSITEAIIAEAKVMGEPIKQNMINNPEKLKPDLINIQNQPKTKTYNSIG